MVFFDLEGLQSAVGQLASFIRKYQYGIVEMVAIFMSLGQQKAAILIFDSDKKNTLNEGASPC